MRSGQSEASVTNSREMEGGEGRDSFSQRQSTEDGQRESRNITTGSMRPEWTRWTDDSDCLSYLAEDKYLTWSLEGGQEEEVPSISEEELTVRSHHKTLSENEGGHWWLLELTMLFISVPIWL